MGYTRWPRYQLLQLNNTLQQVKYMPGQQVYDLEGSASTFYIVMAGSLTMDTCVQSEQNHKLPVTKSQLEIHTIKKRMRYKLRTLKPGMCFGHEEILQDYATRKCRVIADSTSMLTYLDIE